MKITPEAKDLIEQIIPMLRDDVTEIVRWEETEVSGGTLMASGTLKDKNGRGIIRSKTYKIRTPYKRLVDHRKKLEKIIKDSKTAAQMENDLALYLAKNGKSLEVIKAQN